MHAFKDAKVEKDQGEWRRMARFCLNKRRCAEPFELRCAKIHYVVQGNAIGC
jgi:hypothetical protein